MQRELTHIKNKAKKEEGERQRERVSGWPQLPGWEYKWMWIPSSVAITGSTYSRWTAVPLAFLTLGLPLPKGSGRVDVWRQEQAPTGQWLRWAVPESPRLSNRSPKSKAKAQGIDCLGLLVFSKSWAKVKMPAPLVSTQAKVPTACTVAQRRHRVECSEHHRA